MATTLPRPSARERLLAAADELFYEHGVHVVGIDRVLEHADVSKASLYKQFGSKDELVRAYLERRHDRRVARFERHLAAAGDDPRARLLALFDAQAEAFAEPGFRGCAFLRATAENTPEDVAADEMAHHYRAWQSERLIGLARDAGVADPEELAERLVLLYDGATVSSQMDARLAATAQARAIAATLIDAALA